MTDAAEFAEYFRDQQNRERIDNALRDALRGSLGGFSISATPMPRRIGGDFPGDPPPPPATNETISLVTDQHVAPTGTFLTWLAITEPPERSGFEDVHVPTDEVTLTLPAGYTIVVDYDWHSGQGGIVEVWLDGERYNIHQAQRTGQVTVQVAPRHYGAVLQVRTRHSGNENVRVSAQVTIQLGLNNPPPDDMGDDLEFPVDNPDVPTQLAATTGNELDNAYADVSWQGVEGADGYIIRARNLSNNTTVAHTVEGDVEDHRIEWLDPSTEYEIDIRAMDNDGHLSAWSDPITVTTPEDEVPPGPVTGINVTAGLAMIMVTWNENTEPDVAGGEGEYELELLRVDDDHLTNYTTSATVATFNDLEPGDYDVRIRAIDRAGNEGEWSVWHSIEVQILDIDFEIEAGAIETIHLADDAVTTAKIANRAVVAEKMDAIIGGGNLIPNSNFVRGFDDWTESPSSQWTTAPTIGVYGGPGAYIFRQSGSAGSGVLRTEFDCSGGDVVTASCYYRFQEFTGSWRLALRFYDDNGYLEGNNESMPDSSEFTRITNTAIAPEGATRAQVWIMSGSAGAQLYVSRFQAEYGDVVTAWAPKPGEIEPGSILPDSFMPDSITETVIADDAITTPKIAADAVVARNVAANAIEAESIAAAAVVAGKLAADAVEANNLAADSVAARNILAEAIETGHLTAAAVTGEKVEANTITARNMVIGNFDNLVQNPSFDGDLSPHYENTAGGGQGWLTSTVARSSGGQSVRFMATSASSHGEFVLNGPPSDRASHPACSEGDEFAFSAYVRRNTSASQTVQLRVFFYDSSGSAMTGSGQWASATSSNLSASWQFVTVSATAPAGAAWVTAWLYVPSSVTGTVYFDDAFLRNRIDSNLIVDGAITAQKLAVEELITNSAQIATGIINTAHIGTLSAGAITTGTMSGDRIDVNTLNANRLESGSAIVSELDIGDGGRIQFATFEDSDFYLDQWGMTARNFQGDQVLTVDSTTGYIRMVGTLEAGSVIAGTIEGSSIEGVNISGSDFIGGRIFIGDVDGGASGNGVHISSGVIRFGGSGTDINTGPRITAHPEFLDGLITVANPSGTTGMWIGNGFVGAGNYNTNITNTSQRSFLRDDGRVVAYSSNAAAVLGRAGGTGTTISFRSRFGSQVGSVAVYDASTAYNESSDYRLKNELGPVTDAIKQLQELRPIRTEWKNDPDAGEFVSFLAHELDEVFPFAVTGEKDAVEEDGRILPQGVDNSKLIPAIVAAFQSLVGQLVDAGVINGGTEE